MDQNIKELAKDLCKGGCCSLMDWEDCGSRVGVCETAQRIAKYLHKIGYRKVTVESLLKHLEDKP